MNEQKEKIMCFDIDQNKQKINYLLKRDKERDEHVKLLETTIEDLNKTIEDQKQDGEKSVQLLNFDIFRAKDNVHRNNQWDPLPVYFVAQSGTYFDLHIYYTVKNSTTLETQTITLKTFLDGEQIDVTEFELQNAQTHDIDLTHRAFSTKQGHKLMFELRSSADISYTTNNVAPDFYTIELSGTNVQFVSRKFDMEIFTAGDKVCLASCNIDTDARSSIQTADANFSFDSTNFRKYVLATYNRPNQVAPFIHYTIDPQTKTPTFSETAGMTWRAYANAGTFPFGYYGFNFTQNEYTRVSNISLGVSGPLFSRPTIFNDTPSTETQSPNLIALSTRNTITLVNKNGNKMLFNDQTDRDIADCAPFMRIDNFDPNLDIPAVVTRSDGTSFFFIASKTAVINQTPRLELGFGTHANGYATLEGFVVFLRVGSNVNKLLINKDAQGNYRVASKTVLPNLHEYWIGPNGSHFERFGNVIKFFLANNTTPTATIDLTITE